MTFFSVIALLTILLFPFGQLTRTSLIRSEIAFYWHDITILLILLIKRDHIPPIIKNNLYLLGFLVFAVFSLVLDTSILSLSEVTVSSCYLWRWLAYTLFVIILLRNKDKFLAKRLSSYLAITIVLSLTVGLIQYTFFPKFEAIHAAGWDRHAFRLAGTWLDANYTGLLLTLMLFWLFDRLRKLKLNPYLHGLIIVITFISLLLTYSRSAYLALFVGSLVYFAKKKKMYVAVGLCLLVLLSLTLLPRKFGEGTKLERISTVTARIGNWQESRELIEQKPVFGYGFNTLRYIKRDVGLEDEKWQVTHSGSGLDNSLFFLLATVGFAGTFQFFLFWKELLGKIKKTPLLLASLSAVIVHGMFTNSWFYAWALLWIYFVIGEENTTECMSR
ncbi:MAG: O-antigen ligase family protein [Patescibacteria group bacterium]|jgi:O-antigen ligase